MKENKYDNDNFFNKYLEMPRSAFGLQSAGEWITLKNMLPTDFENKRVLDLGCGMGWHCRYIAERNASYVLGVDISKKMLEKAKSMTTSKKIEYLNMSIEELDFEKESFDIVLSSLAFHYCESFDEICKNVNSWLTKGGQFIFSVEHPVFTAYGNQDWYYDDENNKLHWPIDNYFYEGERSATFLNEKVIKYHRTLTTYIKTLLDNNFEIQDLNEPKIDLELFDNSEDMKDELRRPMMLIISAVKK